MLRRSNSCSGSVTAELALALPSVLLVLTLGIGAIGLASWQVNATTIAGDAARQIARGAEPSAVLSSVNEATRASKNSYTAVRDNQLCIFVSKKAEGVLLPIILPEVSATACALME